MLLSHQESFPVIMPTFTSFQHEILIDMSHIQMLHAFLQFYSEISGNMNKYHIYYSVPRMLYSSFSSTFFSVQSDHHFYMIIPAMFTPMHVYHIAGEAHLCVPGK